MSGTSASSPPDRVFAEIEAALSASPRGRAFLAFHAGRSRAADTASLMDAVARLEGRVSRDGMAPNADLQATLAEMIDSVREVRRDLGASTPPPARGADGTRLEHLADEAGGATATILESAEHVQDTAWRMREGGFDAGLCDRLDGLATTIYHACGTREAAMAGTARVVEALLFVEGRALGLERQFAPRGHPPIDPIEDPRSILSDGDIDFVPSPSGAPASEEPSPTACEAGSAGLVQFSELGTQERLQRFT